MLELEYNIEKNKNKVLNVYDKEKVWWKCENNHEWQEEPYKRYKSKNKCPICFGKRLIKGVNDFATLCPQLLKEWDFELNEINPNEILKYSAKKVYWKCKYNHSWISTVQNRTKNKNGCPKCNNKTSFGEQAIYYYLKEIGAENRYKFHKKEIDIYIEKLNIGIEFNGNFWHKNRLDKDLAKELYLSHYMKMFYVLESNENKIINNKVYFNADKNYNKNLEWAIKELFKLVKLNIHVDLDKDELNIKNNYIQMQKEASLAFQNPKLAQEWDYEKNKDLTPEMFPVNSHVKVYWKCKLNHSWKTTINSRNDNHGCPFCNGKKLLKGYNDFATKFPQLVQEWNYDKNTINPNEITAFAHVKVWWKCKLNHEWECYIASRTKTGNNCPICSGKRVLEGFNDLQTTHNYLMKEWDYDKNKIKPTEVSFGSAKKVYWKCELNHSYVSAINMRTKNDKSTGCPYCSNNKLLNNFNDVAKLKPEWVVEWSNKNKYKLTELTKSSSEKIIWNCQNGHEWIMTVADRYKTNANCPYCSGRKPIKGKTDLQTLYPKIMEYWNDENQELYGRYSRYIAKWKCKICNYEWKQQIQTRLNSKFLCPNCKQVK